MIGKLGSSNISEQVSATRELEKLKDPKIVARLMEVLRSSRQSVHDLAGDAILQICKNAGPAAVKLVINGVKDSYSWDVRDKSKEILYKLGIHEPYKKNMKIWWKGNKNKR